MSMTGLSPEALSKLLAASGQGGALDAALAGAAQGNPQVAMAMQMAQQLAEALNDIIARLERIEQVQAIAIGQVVAHGNTRQFEAGYLCNGIQAISALLEDEPEDEPTPDKASAGGGN